MKQDGLQQLMELARRGRERAAADAEPPFGFATRLAARAFPARRDDPLALLDRMTRWSLALAVAVCLVTAVTLEPREPQSSAFANFAGLNEPTGGIW